MSTSLLLKDAKKVDGQEFDYIVVGAGAAGCVLAHRLSDDGKHTVLLVEAGGNHEDETLTKIPIAFGNLYKSRSDWNYATSPQKEAANRELYWPRGKLLGGSTSINAMMYQHAAPEDFAEWESKGAVGWGYESMRPYFRKTEKYTPHAAHADVDLSHRGDSGFWHTGHAHSHITTDLFVETCAKLGIEKTNDINTPKGALGVNHFPTFIDAKGQRSSSATAYLPNSVLKRPNLTVLIDTHTTKVDFSTTTTTGTKRAEGITIAQGGGGGGPDKLSTFTVKAKKEVVLSAGAINTPQLLMLSGVGPAKHLNEMGIPLVADSPHVGANLSDHLAVGLVFRARSSIEYVAHPIKKIPSMIQWLATGKGPLTSNVAEGAAFVRLDDPKMIELARSDVSKLPAEIHDSTSGPKSPDIEILTAPLGFFNHGFSTIPKGTKGYTNSPVLLRPLSTGSITLKTTNPFDAPHIDPQYFTDPRDIDKFVRSVRICMRIARAKPFVDQLIFTGKPNDDPEDPFFIADQDPDTVTDEVVESFVRRRAETLYHPVCTARIGSSVSEGVVSPDLKVYGVEGLRVCDASVFPAQISGHPTATIIAMGEKASEIILASA